MKTKSLKWEKSFIKEHWLRNSRKDGMPVSYERGQLAIELLGADWVKENMTILDKGKNPEDLVWVWRDRKFTFEDPEEHNQIRLDEFAAYMNQMQQEGIK